MRKMLEEKLRRFEELEKLLLDPEVLASPARLSAVASTIRVLPEGT